MTVEQAKNYLANDEFPAGSMGPKVASAIKVVENLDEVRSIICQPGDAVKALRGDSGTNFVK
jgi:carbamate kinase